MASSIWRLKITRTKRLGGRRMWGLEGRGSPPRLTAASPSLSIQLQYTWDSYPLALLDSTTTCSSHVQWPCRSRAQDHIREYLPTRPKPRNGVSRHLTIVFICRRLHLYFHDSILVLLHSLDPRGPRIAYCTAVLLSLAKPRPCNPRRPWSPAAVGYD